MEISFQKGGQLDNLPLLGNDNLLGQTQCPKITAAKYHWDMSHRIGVVSRGQPEKQNNKKTKQQHKLYIWKKEGSWWDICQFLSISSEGS